MTTTRPNPAASDIDSRYGRTPARAKRARRLAIAAAAAFVVVFAAWVIWGGLDGVTESVDTQDTGHRVIDDHTVSINWQVTMAPGTSAACALQAQNEAHGIVGWRTVEIPASTLRTRAFSTEVITSEQAVTGLIYRCWLT